MHGALSSPFFDRHVFSMPPCKSNMDYRKTIFPKLPLKRTVKYRDIVAIQLKPVLSCSVEAKLCREMHARRQAKRVGVQEWIVRFEHVVHPVELLPVRLTLRSVLNLVLLRLSLRRHRRGCVWQSMLHGCTERRSVLSRCSGVFAGFVLFGNFSLRVVFLICRLKSVTGC